MNKQHKVKSEFETEHDWIYSLVLVFVFAMVAVRCEDSKADELDDLYLYDSAYVRIGVGYKVEEKTMWGWNDEQDDYRLTNHPEAARMEIGFRRGNLIYGINHRSQYGQGMPFNGFEEDSYYVTEIFVDYIWEF